MPNLIGLFSGRTSVDALYLEGQNHFVATDSTSINTYGTRQIRLTSFKHRHASTNKSLFKAKLFRLHKAILKASITVPAIPDVLPGQLVTVTAPSANLTSASLRIIEAKHRFDPDGFVTTLTVTDDITNYTTLRLTSMADLLLYQYTPRRVSQREKDSENGAPITLSGMADFTTVAQTTDYPS